jgi:hypothetical protein
MRAHYNHLAPFLSADDANTMLRLAEHFGSFGPYANEAENDGIGEELPQRFDAAFNYIAHGMDGSENQDDMHTAAARTNYFRETYAYGEEVRAPGVEPFMNHPALAETARKISGVERIVPAIIFANILIPGQELAVHTDVPEFRGANRKVTPQWLLVTMLHSGLFNEWRIPITTCVSWFGKSKGGAFAFYPEGTDGPREAIQSDHNSAIVIDTDRVFHGVDRVAETKPKLPPINNKTARLHFMGDDKWQLRNGDEVLGDYDWSELRYSISWKGYCFKDETEENLWRSGSDDLSIEFILNRIEDDLRAQGVLTGARPDPTAFATMMVNHYIRFPKLQAAAE